MPVECAEAMDLDEITRQVQAQYQQFPYPLNDDAKALDWRQSYDFLRFVQLIRWPGRRGLKGLQVLDAGCGTGRTVMWNAVHHPEVDILGIDISAASLDHASRYADEWGIRNARFRQHQILDVAQLGQEFDVIICTGVLHHIPDPLEGLKALKSVLKPDGVLWIMVYGLYGRAGIYIMQRLLRMVRNGQTQAEQAPYARKLVESLHDDHQFSRQRWKRDLDMDGDAGLVDLLLHPQDRAYTVPQLYDWIEAAGLSVWRLFPRLAERLPASHDRPEWTGHLTARERATVAELLDVNRAKQNIFVVHPGSKPRELTVDDRDWLSLVPVLSPFYRLQEATLRTPTGHRKPGIVLMGVMGETAVNKALDDWERACVELCNGRRTLQQICDHPALQQALCGASTRDRREAVRAFLRRAAMDEAILLAPPEAT